MLVLVGHYGYITIAPVHQSSKYVLAIAVPIAAAALWGTFNVPNDPSRSGAAPLRVSGATRLALELSILGFGGYSMGLWNPAWLEECMVEQLSLSLCYLARMDPLALDAAKEGLILMFLC
jgi:hypothetical protein